MAIAAVDLGGTKLAGALVEADGSIVCRDVVPLEGRSGPTVSSLIQQLVSQLASHGQVDAIGVAVPGIYYANSGTVWAPNIPGWDSYPLLEELSALGRVVIESDRTCYIRGEVWKGEARGARDAIYVAVGTGIGAGILVNGTVLRGANDVAGATGWLALDGPFQSEYAACGNFEYHASGPGIARAAGTRNAEEAFAAYQRGDARAHAAIRRAVEYWGRAVANYVSLFNPEIIVFGGGVFGPAAPLINDIYEEALKWAQPISIRQVRVCASALGADAGLYGAAAVTL